MGNITYFLSKKNKEIVKKALAQFENEADSLNSEEIKGGEQKGRGAGWIEFGGGEANEKDS